MPHFIYHLTAFILLSLSASVLANDESKIKSVDQYFSQPATAIFAPVHPQTVYDANIPTLKQVVGHTHGEKISSSTDMRMFLQALAKQANERMKLVKYAESWQGRDLHYAVISSAKNMARLAEIKATLSQLGQGQSLSKSKLEQTPAVVWLSYGVHGNEISPPDSALLMAYHLLAAKNNALVEKLLDETIIIIDPTQNPDGRDRFVHNFESALGLEAQSYRNAAEHREPWPGGRTNHYLFDLNRDWFAMSQPETQGKVAAVLEWHPVVYVDSHEMGGDSTYYFPPAAKPYNPNITNRQRDRQHQLGKNMARWFDQFGEPYFTREVFDAFYPGYGDMWPTLNGAIAMTFEQASARGLVWDRADGRTLTYAHGVRNNVLTSLATIETVAKNKVSYLQSYAEYRGSAISEAKKSSNRYVVLDLSTRRYEAEALARKLVQQGIEVSRVPFGSKQCRANYPAGALVVDMAQPQGRLIKTLLTEHTPLADAFVAEQERRRDNGQYHQMYDVTAWALPLMDGVSAQYCKRVDLDDAQLVAANEPIPAKLANVADFGYVVPWEDGGQARLVIEALKAGLQGVSAGEAFVQNGREFGRGSVVFATSLNEPGLAEKLNELARSVGAEVVPMSTSWVESGPNWGSGSFRPLSMPKIAMAWGMGTNSNSAGNTRFVLERQLGLPVTPIRVPNIAYADLSEFDVLIIPETSGSLIGRFGNADKIAKFAREGGVIVSFASATAQLASESFGLLSTKLEYATNTDGSKPAKTDPKKSRVAGTNISTLEAYQQQIHNHKQSPDTVPGVLAHAVADQTHWLSSGYSEAIALISGRNIFTPLNEADGTNVFRFKGPDELLASGYLWEENRKQLGYKPFVMVQRQGRGGVIAFTQSPTTRAYLNGLNLLLANAVVLGPARF